MAQQSDKAHLKHFECIVTGLPEPDGKLSVFFNKDELKKLQASLVGTQLLIEHGSDRAGKEKSNAGINRGPVGWVSSSRIDENGRLRAQCTIDRTREYGNEAIRRMESGTLGAVSLGWDFVQISDHATGEMTLLDKRANELSLVEVPDVDDAIITNITPDSEQWKQRKQQADMIIRYAETIRACIKSGKEETENSQSAQNNLRDNVQQPNVETTALQTVSVSASASASASVPMEPQIDASVTEPAAPASSSSSAAAAAAAAAAASTSVTESAAVPVRDSTSSTVAAGTDESEALRAQVEALKQELRQKEMEAATTGSKQLDDDVQAIVAEHRERQNAITAAMEKVVQDPALRDKIATDLSARLGNVDELEAVLGSIKDLATDTKYAPLVKYVSAAAGAGAGERATQLQKKIEEDAQKLKEEAARTAAERSKNQQLMATLEALEKQQQFQSLIVGQKRARVTRPAAGFEVHNFAAPPVPSAASAAAAAAAASAAAAAAPALAQPEVKVTGAIASASAPAPAPVQRPPATASHQSEQAPFHPGASASASASSAYGVAPPKMPSYVRPIAPPPQTQQFVEYAKSFGEVGQGMGRMDIPAFTGKDYGPRPLGLDPSGALPERGDISASGPAIPLPRAPVD